TAGMTYWSHQPNRPVAKLSHTANGLISRIEPSAVIDYPLPGHGRGALLVRFGEGEGALAVMIAHLSLRAPARACSHPCSPRPPFPAGSRNAHWTTSSSRPRWRWRRYGRCRRRSPTISRWRRKSACPRPHLLAETVDERPLAAYADTVAAAGAGRPGRGGAALRLDRATRDGAAVHGGAGTRLVRAAPGAGAGLSA